ncbi:hypothetical protein B0H14DRAFT_3759194, partial [Mycena olivaceomarginata]
CARPVTYCNPLLSSGQCPSSQSESCPTSLSALCPHPSQYTPYTTTYPGRGPSSRCPDFAPACWRHTACQAGRTIFASWSPYRVPWRCSSTRCEISKRPCWCSSKLPTNANSQRTYAKARRLGTVHCTHNIPSALEFMANLRRQTMKVNFHSGGAAVEPSAQLFSRCH